MWQECVSRREELAVESGGLWQECVSCREKLAVESGGLWQECVSRREELAVESGGYGRSVYPAPLDMAQVCRCGPIVPVPIKDCSPVGLVHARPAAARAGQRVGAAQLVSGFL